MPARTDKTPPWQGWWEGNFKVKRNGKETEIKEKFVLLALEVRRKAASCLAARGCAC